MSRSGQGYWLRNLKRRVTGRYGLAWMDRLLEAFDDLMDMGEIPVSRLT
jgi:hypothetical protein